MHGMKSVCKFRESTRTFGQMYRDLIENSLSPYVGKLKYYEKLAIWLQLDEVIDFKDDKNLAFDDSDIVDFLLGCVLDYFANYSNERIQTYYLES